MRTGLSLLESAGVAGDGVDVGAVVGCVSIAGGGVGLVAVSVFCYPYYC